MAISGIESAWSRQQQSAFHLELMERWQELSHVDVQLPSSAATHKSWSHRDVSPLLASAPFLATLAPVVQQGQRVLRDIRTGRTTEAVSGTGQLGNTLGRNIHAAQTITQGLNEMFMAQDRYHQARIEVQYKEALARQESAKFYTLNGLNDIVAEQGKQLLEVELFSKILARTLDTQSLIIRNL